MAASKAFKLHAYHETLWALKLKHYTFRRGLFVEYRHVRWTPCRYSPPGDAISAKEVEVNHQGDDQWSCSY
jgi:hypothetical protein